MLNISGNVLLSDAYGCNMDKTKYTLNVVFQFFFWLNEEIKTIWWSQMSPAGGLPSELPASHPGTGQRDELMIWEGADIMFFYLSRQSPGFSAHGLIQCHICKTKKDAWGLRESRSIQWVPTRCHDFGKIVGVKWGMRRRRPACSWEPTEG